MKTFKWLGLFFCVLTSAEAFASPLPAASADDDPAVNTLRVGSGRPIRVIRVERSDAITPEQIRTSLVYLQDRLTAWGCHGEAQLPIHTMLIGPDRDELVVILHISGVLDVCETSGQLQNLLSELALEPFAELIPALKRWFDAGDFGGFRTYDAARSACSSFRTRTITRLFHQRFAPVDDDNQGGGSSDDDGPHVDLDAVE